MSVLVLLVSRSFGLSGQKLRIQLISRVLFGANSNSDSKISMIRPQCLHHVEENARIRCAWLHRTAAVAVAVTVALLSVALLILCNCTSHRASLLVRRNSIGTSIMVRQSRRLAIEKVATDNRDDWQSLVSLSLSLFLRRIRSPPFILFLLD